MKQSTMISDFKIMKVVNGKIGVDMDWKKDLVELYEDVMGDHFVGKDIDTYLPISDMYLLVVEMAYKSYGIGGFMRVMKVRIEDTLEDGPWFLENTDEKEIVIMCEVVSRVKGGGKAFVDTIKKYQTDVFVTGASDDSFGFYEKTNFVTLPDAPDFPNNDPFILRIDKTTSDYKRKQKAIQKRIRKGKQ